MLQIQNFKTRSDEAPESQTNESGMVFQLNYRPEQMKFLQTARVAELEQRIHQLENVLGASSEKLSRLAVATSKGATFDVFP